MTSLRTFFVAPAVLATSLAVLPFAFAQGRDPAGAEALFLAGRDAVTRGDYGAACPKFAESNRLDPAAGTLINLADCEEHLGALASAWDHWKEAVELLPADDARRPIAQRRAGAVEKRVPRLTIKLPAGAPADTKITRDDVEIGIASLNLALPENPGKHAIVVTASGHAPRTITVNLVEGQSQEIVAEPGEASLPPPEPPPPVPKLGSSPPQERPAPRDTRVLGYVIGAAGVVGIGVGAVTGIMAIGKKNDLSSYCHPANVCTPQGADIASSGHTLAMVSTIAFAAGAVATGVGVYFVLSSPRRASMAIGPTAFPGGGGVSIARAF